MNNQNIERWEREFDEEFGVREISGMYSKGIGWYPLVPTPKQIKSFIKALLIAEKEKERTSLLGEIKKKNISHSYFCAKKDSKYRKCCACILDEIKSSLEDVGGGK